MSVISGRVVLSGEEALPYLVVLEREQDWHEEAPCRHLFATMREAEAFIRRSMDGPPHPPGHDRWYA